MTKESDRLKSILFYLATKGYFHWRQNNVGVWDHTKKVFRSNIRQKRGIPDIFCLRNGQIWGIEVKSETGKLSFEQEAFRFDFEANGGFYLLARTVGDLIKAGF